MAKLERKERMKKQHEKGIVTFVLKEGFYNIAIKLGALYLVLTFLIAHRASIDNFMDPAELERTGIFLFIIFVIGMYWSLMWYFVISTEKKREQKQGKKESNN